MSWLRRILGRPEAVQSAAEAVASIVERIAKAAATKAEYRKLLTDAVKAGQLDRSYEAVSAARKRRKRYTG